LSFSDGIVEVDPVVVLTDVAHDYAPKVPPKVQLSIFGAHLPPHFFPLPYPIGTATPAPL
jgi:hypothetical protein